MAVQLIHLIALRLVLDLDPTPHKKAVGTLIRQALYRPGPHTLANAGLTKRRAAARRLGAIRYATPAAVAALLT